MTNVCYEIASEKSRKKEISVIKYFHLCIDRFFVLK